MFTKLEKYILFILFIYYLFITDYFLYLNTVYFFVLLYNICKIFKSFYNYGNKENYYILKYILISIFLFFCSYYLIYDPNPIYYLFTFYLPFENYFKGILAIIFHTYFLNKFSAPKKKNYKRLEILHDSEIIRLANRIIKNDKPSYNFEYFLSKQINYFKKNKKKFFQFVISLIIIKILLYFYRTKYWIYFNKKEKILPITTSKNTKFYMTSCVYNMEPIIVDYINELKKLIKYLGEDNIIISIVENGDSTDKTRDYLIEFQKYLNETKIINKFYLNHEIKDKRKKIMDSQLKDYYRIKFLAQLRNKCFEFLYEIPNLDFENTKIINFNDIIFRYEEIIKLLSTNNEDYDAVCAMDFYYNFYDNWVSIDLDGNILRDGFPYFINKEAQDLLINRKPIRIFSCWNGVIVFTASPFKDRAINFRDEKYIANKTNIYKLNPEENYHIDFESECSYFHLDLQTMGYNKRFINPEIRVAYTYWHYYYSNYILPNTIELLNYFGYYIRYFYRKRNKYMSNYKDKNVKLSAGLQKWYLIHKLMKKRQRTKPKFKIFNNI